MAEGKHKDFLAARVLADNQPVTYRLLSRALQVNVNTAKWMLFDFHQKQNAKQPNSVHATYIVTGTKRDSKHPNGATVRDGKDVAMRSSPFMSSMPEPEEQEDSVDGSGGEEPVNTTTIVLVPEEKLQETRNEFAEETSIHIYSLQHGPIKDLSLVSESNREIARDYSNNDPMAQWSTYGSIHNPYIKRRTVKSTPPVTKAASKAVTKPAPPPIAKPTTKHLLKKEASVASRRASASEDNASDRSTPQPTTGTSTLKRSDSKSGVKTGQTAGALFKSFAKAKPKAKDAGISQDSTPAPAEDEPMQDMSEDEDDGGDEPALKIDEEKNDAARKAREDRQEKLRQMMEDDDDDMPDAPGTNDEQVEASSTVTLDTVEPPQGESTVTVQNGRRRGRRRVMKKKKVKDEEGYLVTKEEAVWESFSEDEPDLRKPKPAPARPSSSAKGKPAGKKGQGSIANFFKKA